MQYDVDYFIKKFEAIHEDLWCTTDLNFNGKSCALGHCGVKSEDITMDGINHEEGSALADILNVVNPRSWQYAIVYSINDSTSSTFKYNQPNPRERILAALYDAKDLQLEEANIKSAQELINKNITPCQSQKQQLQYIR